MSRCHSIYGIVDKNDSDVLLLLQHGRLRRTDGSQVAVTLICKYNVIRQAPFRPLQPQGRRAALYVTVKVE